MNPALVSVIIACSEDASFAWRCFDRLSTSRYRPLEFVLVDDASLEDPFAFLPAVRSREGITIRIHRMEQTIGIPSARRRGAEEANGKILIFVDPRSAIPFDIASAAADQLASSPLRALTVVTCPLVQGTWEPDTGPLHTLVFDDRLDFHWAEIPDCVALAVPVASPACLCMPTQLYRQSGGFGGVPGNNLLDHLRLSMEIYRAGGGVHLMEAQPAGYLFRDGKPPVQPTKSQKGAFCDATFGNAITKQIKKELTRPFEVYPITYDARERPRQGGLDPDEYFRTFAFVPDREGSRQKIPVPAHSKRASAKIASHSRTLQFGGGRLRMEIDSDTFRAHVDARYGLLQSDRVAWAGERGVPTVHVTGSHDTFHLSGPFGSVRGEYAYIAHKLKEQTVRFFVASNPHLMWFHAGAASTDEGAIVFISRHGAGKSTLVVALCQIGFKYVADDILPVDVEKGLVHPFPLSPLMRSPTSDDIASHNVLNMEMVISELSGDAVQKEPVPILAFVRPQYRRGHPPEIVDESKAAGCLELLQGCFNLQAHGRSGLDKLSRIGGKVPFSRVCFNQGPEGARAIAAWSKRIF